MCGEAARKNSQLYHLECGTKCDFVYYNWKQTVIKNGGSSKWGWQIDLVDATAPFTEFTVAHKNTQEQFLSQIGGVINLYLGFSGLSLTAIVIFCVELIKRWVRRSRSIIQEAPRDQQCSLGIEMQSGFCDIISQKFAHIIQKIEEMNKELANLHKRVQAIENSFKKEPYKAKRKSVF